MVLSSPLTQEDCDARLDLDANATVTKDVSEGVTIAHLIEERDSDNAEVEEDGRIGVDSGRFCCHERASDSYLDKGRCQS